jgi:predicted nucleic acid-binding Zn ribbon protein
MIEPKRSISPRTVVCSARTPEILLKGRKEPRKAQPHSSLLK